MQKFAQNDVCIPELTKVHTYTIDFYYVLIYAPNMCCPYGKKIKIVNMWILKNKNILKSLMSIIEYFV
jgi:hypothetical protein